MHEVGVYFKITGLVDLMTENNARKSKEKENNVQTAQAT